FTRACRAAADRYGRRTRGSRRGRVAAVLLRRVGRRRQCRVPDGVHRGRWPHSGTAAGLRTTPQSLPLRGTRRRRGEGQGRYAYLVPNRPKWWPTRLTAKGWLADRRDRPEPNDQQLRDHADRRV